MARYSSAGQYCYLQLINSILYCLLHIKIEYCSSGEKILNMLQSLLFVPSYVTDKPAAGARIAMSSELVLDYHCETVYVCT